MTDINKAPDISPASNVAKIWDKTGGVFFGAQVYGKYLIFRYVENQTSHDDFCSCFFLLL